MPKKDEEKKKDPYALKNIFTDMEMELVQSFHRNLVKHRIDEHDAGFSWEMWQVSMLRNIEQYRKENQQIIGNYRPSVKEAVDEVLNYRYEQGMKNVDKQTKQKEQTQEPKTGQIDMDHGSFSFPEDGRNVGELGQTPPKETQFFDMNKKKLNALIASTTKDMEDVCNAVYRKMDDVYRQTIYKSVIQLNSGAISLEKAIDKATEDFLTKGIDSVVYKNGRHVNIATYAEMALRTASQRATFLGEGTKRDEYGNHLVVISTHLNCCKLCFPWQGQILIDDVFSHPSEEYMVKRKGKYKLLSVAIKAGLLHPNCRHTLATWFEGISRTPKIYDKEEAKKSYEAEQKQRALENAIRKAKREQAGAVDKENKDKATSRVRTLQKQLREHVKAHPELKRNQRREKKEPFIIEELMNDGLKIQKFKSTSNELKMNPNNHSENIVDEYFSLMDINTTDKAIIDYIKKDISMMPLSDLELLRQHKVSIETSNTNSKYRYILGKNRIYITSSENKGSGSFAHEFAHYASRCTELYKQDEFLDVIGEAMKGATLYKKTINKKLYMYVKSKKFVRDYQGRTYLTPEEFEKQGGVIRSRDLKEYVSVGYQTYITNPQLLYEKDQMLYDYFEKVGLVNERKK